MIDKIRSRLLRLYTVDPIAFALLDAASGILIGAGLGILIYKLVA